MRVATNTFYSGFIGQLNLLQQTQNRLQNEVTTGQSFSLPEENPEGMAEVLGFQGEINTTSQYQNNISQLQQTAGTTSDTINSLQTLMSQASEIATSAVGTNSPEQMATYANQIEAILKQAIQLGNTQFNGQYIFAADK